MKIRNKIMRVILVPFLCMLVGYVFLVISYCIPNRWIIENVKESAETLLEQGIFPSGFLEGWFLDNSTDADCIAVSINKSSQNIFYNAINAFHYCSKENTNIAGPEGLYSTVNGYSDSKLDHSYLWHGFRIWLRFLLIKYNVTQIRYLLYFVNIIAVTFLCILLVQVGKNNWAFLPFLFSFTYFVFQVESMSLLFFNDLFVALISSIILILLYKNGKEKYLPEFFSGVGSYLAFSSMLILPMLTIGFPLIVLMTLKKEHNWKENMTDLLQCSLSWGLGYGLTMVTKIILSITLINSSRGLNNILLYTGKGEFSLIDRFKKVKEVFLYALSRSESEFDLFMVLIIIFVVYLLLKRIPFQAIKNVIPILFVGLYPCIWCFICVGHSLHWWTCWNYSITLFSVLQALWELRSFHKEESPVNDNKSME